jgi:hypothetical protein
MTLLSVFEMASGESLLNIFVLYKFLMPFLLLFMFSSLPSPPRYFRFSPQSNEEKSNVGIVTCNELGIRVRRLYVLLLEKRTEESGFDGVGGKKSGHRS